jgi:hypothetical protein
MAIVKDIVRRAAAKGFMGSVLVVPIGNQIQFALCRAPRKRNDRQTPQAFFQRADATLDNGNAAVLA